MESTTCSLLGRMGLRVTELTERAWSTPTNELTDLIKDAHRLAAQIDALRLAAVRQADLRGLARAADATDTTSWLSGMLRMNPREASKLVKLSAHLDRDLPATSAALAAGEISVGHAQVISRTVQELPDEADTPDVRAQVDETLAGQARDFSPDILRRLGDHVLNIIDPELADRILADKLDKEEKKAAKERSMRISPLEDGNLFLIRVITDPLTAERLQVLTAKLAAPRTCIDGQDQRTPDQRNGDAFAEIIELAHDCNLVPKQGGNKPQIVVTIPAGGNGVGRTRRGLKLSPELVEQLMCEAERAFLLQDHLKPGHVYLTDPERLYTGKLRRLLEDRDGGCAFPGCCRPAEWCHAHHIIPWSKGGPTTLENGVMLCGFHHRVIHQRRWIVRMAGDGLPEFIPPHYIDPDRDPIRNTMHHH